MKPKDPLKLSPNALKLLGQLKAFVEHKAGKPLAEMTKEDIEKAAEETVQLLHEAGKLQRGPKKDY